MGSAGVIRHNMKDTRDHEASFDYPLHDAGDFDAITNVWIHLVTVWVE